MATRAKKHKITIQVGENEDELLRIILPRKSTVRDLAQAVRERLHKRPKTGGNVHEAAPRVTEIRERRKIPSVSGGRLHAWGPAASALQLDEDDTLSDLIESDTEGPMFVAMIDGSDCEQSARSPREIKKDKCGSGPDKKGKSGKGKNKAEVPHKIPYTVAGMPRGDVGGGDGDRSVLDRRGPREGILAASTSWTLLDLKRAIAMAEGIRFTPDRVAPLRNEAVAAFIDIKVTISPNVTVPMSVSQAQTFGDIFRKVARATRAAKEEEQKSAMVKGTVDVDLGAVVAAATDAASRPEEDSDGGGHDTDGGEQDSDGEGESSSEVDAFLAPGYVLMHQKAVASGNVRVEVATRDVDLLSTTGYKSIFLDVADPSIHCQSCNLEGNEEYVLVGPGAISPDNIPLWMVRLRVLGQLLGSIQIPNRRLASATMSPKPRNPESEDNEDIALGNSAPDGCGTQNANHSPKQLHTLGDLRDYLARMLDLPSKRMEIWVAPPESGGALHTKLPRGEKALFDQMSLGHYGLCHLGVVDVRLPDSPHGDGDAGATGGVNDASKGNGNKTETGKKEDDLLRITVKTARARARGDMGAELFVFKQTFSLTLVKGLAARALGVPFKSVSRVEIQNSSKHSSTHCGRWGSHRVCDYDIRHGSTLVLHLFARTSRVMVPRLASKNLEKEEDAAPTLRMTVALWAEVPNDDDGDPWDVSTPGSERGGRDGALSTTLCRLQSTPKTDAVSLKEWGLLGDGVHVYAVFYVTRSPISAVASEAGSYRQDKFGTAPCWRPRPLPASLVRHNAQTAAVGESQGTGSEDDSVDMEEEGGGRIEAEIGDDSQAGMACFLSSLYAMDAFLRKVAVDERYDKERGTCNTVGWLLRELMLLLYPRFPPAALALTFADGTEAECACLAQCLWSLAREVVPSSVPDGAVFEHARTVLAWLTSRSANAREDARKDASRNKTIAAAATAASTMGSKISAESRDAGDGGEPQATSTEGDAIASQSDTGDDEVKLNVKVDSVALTCCRVLERLEPNHAVRVKVDGAMLEGIYSRGGALEKEQELREAGATGLAQSVTVEIVPWKAVNRLLLASPMSDELTVLRLKHPHPNRANAGEQNEDPTSWLSLMDWRTVFAALGSQPWARVIPPLSLPGNGEDRLTRDRNGHLAVYVGQSKGAERSVHLFSPLDGGKTTTEDVHVLAQALAMLAKKKGGLLSDGFDSAEATTRMALEGIVVCMDSSYSMGGQPGFADDHDSDTGENSGSSKKRELKFDWSTPFPEATDDPMSEDSSADAPEGEEAENMDGYDMEMRRAKLKKALKMHRCLPQLREVATLFSRGSSSNLVPMPPVERVLEEIIMENFDRTDSASWETAEANMKICRLYRQEFLDILLKDEEDTGRSATSSDFSDWAGRQFICPITQGIMIDPVVTADGHSYERHAILQWFSECRANSRRCSSPLSGVALASDAVTSNHALKSSIQDWLLNDSRGDETSGADPKCFQVTMRVKINLRYGSKSEEITVNRASGQEGIKSMQVMVAHWAALEIFGSDNSGDAISLRRRMVAPQAVKLVHQGLRLTSLWMLKEGDMVMALDVDIDSFASFTLKIKYEGKEVYLLVRKDETLFSIKLRLWAQDANMRPSRTEIWRNLRSAGDGTILGWLLSNSERIPRPKILPRIPEAPSGNSGDEGGDRQGGGEGGNDEGRGEGGGHEEGAAAAGSGDEDDASEDGDDSDCVDDVELGVDDSDDGDSEDDSDDGDSEDDSDDEDEDGNEDGVCVLEAFWEDPFSIKPNRDRPSLTRLDAVKQLFHAFINRAQAYDIPMEVGLVNFGSDVKVACEPSPLLEEFRSKVDDLTHSGDTRLWDALQMACTVLERWRTEWLKTARKRRAAERSKNTNSDRAPVLRIVVLSDGEDTKSSAAVHSVCLRLQKAGILVDSITVGTEKNESLKCVSLATGGYAFHPGTLRDALRLNELETVLSSLHREPRKEPGAVTIGPGAPSNTSKGPNIVAAAEFVRSEHQLLSAERLGRKYDTEETATFKKDPRIHNICRPLGTALARLGPADSDSTAGMRGGGSGGGRMGGGMVAASAATGTTGDVNRERSRRVRREMMDMMKNPHEAFEVFPSNQDMCFWKVLLVGPESTPYRDGCWMLSLYFPPRYPSVAPTVRFVTSIRHCNINAHGRVCHALLDRSWTPNTTVSAVFGCVYGLLLYPDHDDPLDSTLALQMYDSSGDYETAIMNHVKEHASKPKAMWVTELEAAGMSSQDRLAQCHAALAQAKEALSSGGLDEAKRKAWKASIYAAGGPASVKDVPRPRGAFTVRHDLSIKAFRTARAEACMVVAWAELKKPRPDLEEISKIAANARLHNESSPDVTLCLAKVAEVKWKQSEAGSVEAVAYLKEAIKQQTLHLRMTDRNSAARKQAKETIDTLKIELKRIDSSQASRDSLRMIYRSRR